VAESSGDVGHVTNAAEAFAFAVFDGLHEEIGQKIVMSA
jgi:hypothetical protein